jgi:hypothetical protein
MYSRSGRGFSKPLPGAQLNWAHPDTRGLIGFWLFNEGAGNAVRDLAQYGNGKLVGGAKWGGGPGGNCLNLVSANSQYVRIPVNAAHPFTNAKQFTLEIRFKINSNRNYNALITKTNGNTAAPFDMYIDASGTLNCIMVSGAGGGFATSGFLPNVWYTVTFSWDGIYSLCHLSINGRRLAESATGAANLGGGDNTAKDIIIGSRDDTATLLDGSIDYVKIWQKVFSASDVQEMYADPYRSILPASFRLFGAPSGALGIPTGPTSRAVYAPVVTGGANSLFVLSIPQYRAVYSPVVTGPITMPAGPSNQVVYAPTVTVNQTIALSGTVSVRSVYSPTVANIQTIAPGTVAGLRAVYAPVVTGGPQYISLQTVPGKRAVYTPTITGGTQGLYLFLSGVDRTQYLSLVEGTAQIQGQTIGRWQMTFDLFDATGTFAPVLGQTVVCLDFGNRAFAGCITEIVNDRALSTTQAVTYHCTAVDKSGICDHRVVPGITFKAGEDVASVILRIVANYLTGEGITTQGVPQDGSLGTLTADLSFNFPTATKAFDQIAQLTGTVWWIDPFGILNFSSFSALPAAPFSLGEATQNWRGQQDGRGIQVAQTTVDYYNKLYAVSNLNIVPGSGSGGGGGAGQTGYTETFTMTAGTPGVTSTSVSGVPNGILMSTAIGSVISITVDGHAQTVYDEINNYHGQTRTGSNDYLWFFAQGDNQIDWTFGPPAGATVVVQYVPYQATNTSLAQYGTAITPLDPFGAPLGTCGSGVYEGVVQVDDISSQADLDAIASAELARIGGVPTTVKYQTDYPGLKPGQKQHIDIPLSGIASKDLLITQVTFTLLGADLGHGTMFRCDVQGTTNLDPGNWLKWFERLVGRTANALPILQYEDATFVLGAGSSLAGGLSLTNPYIVSRTGLMIEVVIAAAVPPVDETLVLQLTDNGTIIATITMPPATVANQLITLDVPKSNQLYLYKGDVLNVNASYQVTGLNPTPAQSLTLKARWAM